MKTQHKKINFMKNGTRTSAVFHKQFLEMFCIIFSLKSDKEIKEQLEKIVANTWLEKYANSLKEQIEIYTFKEIQKELYSKNYKKMFE